MSLKLTRSISTSTRGCSYTERSFETNFEIAGDEPSYAEADALDARFDELTVIVGDSPFAAGSGVGSIRDDRRKGWWWSRLPADAVSRSYTLTR